MHERKGFVSLFYEFIYPISLFLENTRKILNSPRQHYTAGG
jgi:hypothetical protein